MKKFLAVVLLFVACNAKETDLSTQAAAEITKADEDMNAMASKQGFYKALLAYADDSVVKPGEAELPVVGKNALDKNFQTKTETKDISWQPVKAMAATSGDLGYTLGNWKYTSKDTTMYGFYYTIWKKQTDGTWKFLVDGGNNTPKPW